jgi:hypothetical protein
MIMRYNTNEDNGNRKGRYSTSSSCRGKASKKEKWREWIHSLSSSILSNYSNIKKAFDLNSGRKQGSAFIKAFFVA